MFKNVHRILTKECSKKIEEKKKTLRKSEAVPSKGAHGPILSDLTLKSDQTKNFGLENFQTGPDHLNCQTGTDQTVLQRFGMVWFTVFYFYIFFQINICSMNIFRTYKH